VTRAIGRARPHWILFFAIAAAVVILDQASKAWLTGLLDPGERMSIIGDWLRIVHGQNDGAIFGLFKDQALLFGLVSLGVVGLIIWYQATAGRNLLTTVALGLLLGGAIGNMIDRFRLGYVVDWVDAGIGDWRFYTFNVADSAVSVAVLLLLLIAIVPGVKSAGDVPATAEDDASTPTGDDGTAHAAPDPTADKATADTGTADA
jgi:signal peptidase II